MINKKDQSDPIDNLEYEKVLEEEIINSYESKFQKDTEEDSKKMKFYRLKRTPLEILNRSFFFFFIGSFLFSLFLIVIDFFCFDNSFFEYSLDILLFLIDTVDAQ